MLDGNNKELKFAISGGTYVGLKAPLGLVSDITFTLPGFLNVNTFPIFPGGMLVSTVLTYRTSTRSSLLIAVCNCKALLYE